MMIEPVDSKIATGTAAIDITEEVPASSFEWATLGLRRGVPTGKR
jgi:hypothetical protein